MNTERIMSENDRLDYQLRNGTDYVNLPSNTYPRDRAPTWIAQQEPVNAVEVNPREIRYLHHLRPSTTGSQISRDHYSGHQQMDAENRLRHLELIRPKENVNLLKVKYHTLQHPRHARPILPQYRDDYVTTLYNQMGTYVQERAGLYHTENYEPSALVQAIPQLENQEGNTSLSQDENYLGASTNQSQPKLFQTKAIGDYQHMRNYLLDKLRVSPDASTVDSRTQEGQKQFVQRQSTYGQAYNTPKFLQDNTLAYHARIDPSRLMSTRYNNDLEQVRNLNSYPMKPNENPSANNKQDSTLVSPIHRPLVSDEIYTTKLIAEHTDGYTRRPTTRVYDSPFKNQYETSTNQFSLQSTQSQPTFDPILSIPAQLPRSVKTAIRLPGPEIVARSIEPKLEPRTNYQRSYKDIIYHESRPSQANFIRDNQQRFARASDNRFKQWKLTDLQDRWSKTQAQQQYHTEYPEVVPDVGGITIRARKELLIADTIAKKAMLTIR